MNQASVDYRFRYACDALSAACPGQLRAIFSPQHGLWGEQQANMLESPHEIHPRLQLPIYSLYSETRRPLLEMLAGLDCLVIDLQDVGTRVYTFIWTVSHCLEACVEAGIPVVVLDRPNPLGGEQVEGPLLDDAFSSFVGRAPMPMRHGLTVAEAARYINDALNIGAEIQVVPLRGWRRSMSWMETGRPWIVPSPNLPRPESVWVYPGQVLLEGTNLSEGRGTTTPFEICGAPFIDPDQLRERLLAFDLPGVVFRPVRFLPTFDKWAGQLCQGLVLHVTDLARFRPYRTALAILASVHELWPDQFQWLAPPYEYETEKMPIDIITGSDRVRLAIEQGQCQNRTAVDELADLDYESWWNQTSPYRLYH